MKTFRFECMDKNGVTISGVVEAESQNEAVFKLRETGNFVTNIKEAYFKEESEYDIQSSFAPNKLRQKEKWIFLVIALLTIISILIIGLLLGV